MNTRIAIVFLIFSFESFAQSRSAIYATLPVGPNDVGFKIVTLDDDSRISKPAINYLGEKDQGDRTWKIKLHIWYPAKRASSSKQLTVSDYALHEQMSSVGTRPTTQIQENQIATLRNRFERFFGKAEDAAWNEMLSTKLLALPDADPLKEKFPLLIGVLRGFSTTITNELLASNGYVVVMVQGDESGTFATAALRLVPDMQKAMAWSFRNLPVDETRIGTFGFSGSGFIQLLLAMSDSRIQAHANIESALFGIDFRDSDYYNASKLKIPFLYIYNRELAKRDTHFDEFYKLKFSKRYHLHLNQEQWHHWNVATEGFLSCVILKNRGPEQDNIRNSFEIANIYLLNFFNLELKNSSDAKTFLNAKPSIAAIPPRIWDIDIIDAVKAAPTVSEFNEIIESKGINTALGIARSTLASDSSLAKHNRELNNLGYRYMSEGKFNEAIGVFTFNADVNPDDPNWVDSLAEAYESSGDKPNAKKTAQRVLEMLAKKKELTDFEKSLKTTAERRINL